MVTPTIDFANTVFLVREQVGFVGSRYFQRHRRHAEEAAVISSKRRFKRTLRVRILDNPHLRHPRIILQIAKRRGARKPADNERDNER